MQSFPKLLLPGPLVQNIGTSGRWPWPPFAALWHGGRKNWRVSHLSPSRDIDIAGNAYIERVFWSLPWHLSVLMVVHPPLVDLCKLNAKATFGFGFGNGGGTILIHIAAVQPYMQKLL